MAGGMYDAFISYSHTADRLTARSLQKGLENCNRRWLGPRRLRVFRDETDLSVAPSLWGVVEQALDSSRFFILLASPQAAESKWVSKEISHWTKTRSPATILVVVTDGSYGWNDQEREFNRIASSAVPPALFGLFSEEPLFLDLRDGPLWKRSRSEQQRAIATLAAPIHGKSKEELLGLEVQLYRRRLLLTVLAFSLIAVLAAGFFWQAIEAGRQRDEARRQRDEARRQGEEAGRQRDEARRQRDMARAQLLATRSTLALRQERASPAFWFAVEAWTRDSNWVTQKALYDFARSGLRSTFEHGSLVSDAVISRSGTYVATAGVRLKVWKADGTPVFSAGGKAGALAFVDFAPDERCVAYEGFHLQGLTLSGSPEFELPTESWAMTFAGFFPDSHFLLTAAYRQPIKRWDRKGRLLMEYRYESDLSSLSISHDGSSIAAGTSGGEVKLWRANGAVLGAFRDREEVISVEFSLDDSQVMSLTRNGSLTVRSIRGGASKVIASQDVLAAAMSPRGTQVATLSTEGTIRVLNLDGQTLRTLEGSLPVPAEPRTSASARSAGSSTALRHLLERRPGWNWRLGSICFAEGGRLVAASTGDTTRVWDLETSRLLKNAMKGELLSVSPDGRYLVTRGEYSALLWELEPGAGTVVRCESIISDVAVAPDGSGFVTASLDGNARLWNANGQVTATLAHGAPVMSASFSHDGQTVATVGRNSVVRLWSRTGTFLRDFPHAETVHYAAFSPDDRCIVTTAADGTATLWSVEGQKLAVFNHDGEVYHAAFSPDGRLIATAAADRMIRVWTQAGALSWECATSESVQKVAFSPGGQQIVAVTTGNELSIFESGSGRLTARLKHTDELITADVPPTGNIVITSAADRVVRVWDMSGGLLARMDHLESVGSVCVSRDGMRVLTASEDGCARLWDLNGNELFVFSDVAPLKQAVFSTDGRHILTRSAHSVSLWDFGSPESIIAHYGKTVGKIPAETIKNGS